MPTRSACCCLRCRTQVSAMLHVSCVRYSLLALSQREETLSETGARLSGTPRAPSAATLTGNKPKGRVENEMRNSHLLLAFLVGACGVDSEETETEPQAAVEYCSTRCPSFSGTYVASRICSQSCTLGCSLHGWNKVTCEVPSGESYWECRNRSGASGLKPQPAGCTDGYHVTRRANRLECKPSITGGSNSNFCEKTPVGTGFTQCGTVCPDGYVAVGKAITSACAGANVTAHTPNQVRCVPQPTTLPEYTECHTRLPGLPSGSPVQSVGCGNGYHVKSRHNVPACGPPVFGGSNANKCELTPSNGTYRKCGSFCPGGIVVGKYKSLDCAGADTFPQTVNQVDCAAKPTPATGPAVYEHCGYNTDCEPGYHPTRKINLTKCGPFLTGGTNTTECTKTRTSGVGYRTCSAFCEGGTYVDSRAEYPQCSAERVTYAVPNSAWCMFPTAGLAYETCGKCTDGYRSVETFNRTKCGQPNLLRGNARRCEPI